MPWAQFGNNPAKNKFLLKFASYWKSVLRFGLPFAVVYYGINYAAFCVVSHHQPSAYHWGSAIISAVVATLVASAVWWLLMRKIVARRHLNQ